MVEPKDTVPKEVNGYILLLTPSTFRAEESNGKSKFKRLWKNLGFEGKKLWDLLDLLLAPFLVALLLLLIGQYFEGRAKEKEEYFNSERNKQEILRNYLTTMTDLISDRKLKNDNKDLTNIAAKALTQSALTSFDNAVLPPKLRDVVRDVDKKVLTGKELDAWEKSESDASRKGQVLQFVYDAQLITNNSPKIDMGGIDLQGVNLQGMVLGSPEKSMINLSRAELSSANLKNAKLEKAQMRGIRLQAACLEAADLTGANLKEANLQGANLKGANLQSADLSYADLTGSDLTNANLTHPSGSKNTHDIKLIGANLKGAKLIGADLSNAHLDRANLTDANLTGAKLTEIADATLCRTTMPEGTVDSSSCRE